MIAISDGSRDRQSSLWPFGRAHQFLHAGYCTCIAPVPELLLTSSLVQTPTPASLAPSHKPPASATWQMLTGHRLGHVQLWQASHQGPLQALAIIRAPRSSPVQSLVVLQDLHLICSGHLDGHIALHITPRSASAHQCIPPCQVDGSLPALTLPTATFEAHRSGLQNCVAGDSGLVSLGALGSIMVWPRAELQGMLSNAGLHAFARYCFCHGSAMPSHLVC